MTTTRLQLNAAEQRRLRHLWQTEGLLRDSYPLANPALVEPLKADWPLYQMEIQRNRGQALYRVPYLLTQAIWDAAHDPNILAVASAALGTDELVMWGPNIQLATPNEADLWHTDIESWLWPSLTLVVGLDGCTSANSTQCIPGSHKLPVQPWGAANNRNSARVLEAARRLGSNCREITDFNDFGNGRFYAFDAKCWHAGRSDAARDRQLLLMHFQRAADPRIPYMLDYEARTWFNFPAAYIKLNTATDFKVNPALYDTADKDYRGAFKADFEYLE